MVERNYRLWCSMNDIPLEEGTVDEDDDEEMDLDEKVAPSAGDEDAGEWGGIMDVDGAEAGNSPDETPSFFQELKQASSDVPKTKSKRKKTKVAALVREKIRKVLEDDTELADQRSGKCTENDFLKLLAAFNAEGLHFS
jgi:18S rRNA (adenine1779-N6/adenine1780-N6)-dimethyltransferase